MHLVHDDLTPKQRMLCAYLGRKDPPKGFKGNSVQLDDGKTIERNLDHFMLSRYAYVRSALRKYLEERFYILFLSDGTAELPHRFRLTRKSFETARSVMTLHHKNGRWISEIDARHLRDAFDDETLRIVNRFYRKFVLDYASQLEDHLLSLVLASPDFGFKQEMKFLMSAGYDAYVSDQIVRFIEAFLNSDEARQLTAKQVVSVELLHLAVYSDYVQYSFDAEKESKGSFGEYRRALFSNAANKAWRSFRRILSHEFHELDENFVLTNLPFCVPIKTGIYEIRRLVKLHKRYGSKFQISDGSSSFTVEASPFSQKLHDIPDFDLSLVVYPNNDDFKQFLKRVRNTSFEHANGAVAIAPIVIRPPNLVLLELQSDVSDIVKGSGTKRTPPAGFMEMLDSWGRIAVNAVREFAREHGFTEFFLPTPEIIFRKYGGSLHPYKGQIYYKVPADNGARLVYDEHGDLGEPMEPAYWWRFDVR